MRRGSGPGHRDRRGPPVARPPPKRSRACGPGQVQAEGPRPAGVGLDDGGAGGAVGQLGQLDGPELDRRGRAAVDQDQDRLGRVGPDQPGEGGGGPAVEDRRPRGAGVEHDAGPAAPAAAGDDQGHAQGRGWPPVTVSVSRCGRPGWATLRPTADQARPVASAGARFAASDADPAIQPRSRSRRLASTRAASGTAQADRPGASTGDRPEAVGR